MENIRELFSGYPIVCEAFDKADQKAMLVQEILTLFSDTIVITNRKLVKGDYLEQIRKVVSLHPYGLILRERHK